MTEKFREEKNAWHPLDIHTAESTLVDMVASPPSTESEAFWSCRVKNNQQMNILTIHTVHTMHTAHALIYSLYVSTYSTVQNTKNVHKWIPRCCTRCTVQTQCGQLTELIKVGPTGGCLTSCWRESSPP